MGQGLTLMFLYNLLELLLFIRGKSAWRTSLFHNFCKNDNFTKSFEHFYFLKCKLMTLIESLAPWKCPSSKVLNKTLPSQFSGSRYYLSKSIEEGFQDHWRISFESFGLFQGTTAFAELKHNCPLYFSQKIDGESTLTNKYHNAAFGARTIDRNDNLSNDRGWGGMTIWWNRVWLTRSRPAVAICFNSLFCFNEVGNIDEQSLDEGRLVSQKWIIPQLKKNTQKIESAFIKS